MNSKLFRGLILAAGVATLGLLLWKLEPARVWELLRRIGWGWLIIIPGHGIDHVFNAWGWKFTFSADDSRRVSLLKIYVARIAGDGVNYLTPSGTIAGEVVRPGMLGSEVSEQSKIASVIVAKFTQAIAQVGFILIGLALLLHQGLTVVESARKWIPWMTGALVLACLGVCAFGWYFSRRSSGKKSTGGPWSLLSIQGQIADFFRDHPGRFALSIAFFILGYAWGIVEVLLVCHFLGVPIGLLLATGVEVLSTMIDGMTFMVPAKIGTQEAGKTAIFAGLGLGAGAGFAFGAVRHLRELIWAAGGLALYTLQQRAQPAPEPPRKDERPLSGAVA